MNQTLILGAVSESADHQPTTTAVDTDLFVPIKLRACSKNYILFSFCFIPYNQTFLMLGRGGGLVVSILAYYSEDPSSNPTVY